MVLNVEALRVHHFFPSDFSFFEWIDDGIDDWIGVISYEIHLLGEIDSFGVLLHTIHRSPF